MFKLDKKKHSSLKTIMLSALTITACSLSMASLDGLLLKAKADDLSFSAGNSAVFGGASNDADLSWGIAFDTHNNVSTNSNIVGAKITIMTLPSDLNNQLLNLSDRDAKRKFLKEHVDSFNLTGTPQSFGPSATYQTYYVFCNPCSYQTYIYNYSPYAKNTGSENDLNVPGWIKADSENSTVAIGLYKEASTYSPILNAFGNYDTAYCLYGPEIFTVNSDRVSFNKGENELPEDTKQAICKATENLAKSSSFGLNEHEAAIWYVEPIMHVDIVAQEKGVQDWVDVAATPMMLGYFKDFVDYYNGARPELRLSYSGLNAGGYLDSMIDIVRTNELSGNSSASLDKYPTLNSETVKVADTDSVTVNEFVKGDYGAYAHVVLPEDVEHLDTLPQIPSIPIFTGTSDSISYSGKSASVSKNTWDEYISCLSYGLNLSDTVPSNGLYSSNGFYFDNLRKVSRKIYDEDNNYTSEYIDRYIDSYNSSIVYNNSTPLFTAEDNKLTYSPRNSTNQPESVSSKFGTGSAPIETPTALGGIRDNQFTISAKNVRVFVKSSATDVVSTGATSISELGTEVTGTVTVGQILQKPYAYSIVIDNSSTTTVTGDNLPQRPNIVIYDEHESNTLNPSGSNKNVIDATISDDVWNDVLGEIQYARGESDISPLGTTNGEKARKALNRIISLDEDIEGAPVSKDSGTILDTDMYESWLDAYDELKNQMNVFNSLKSHTEDVHDITNSLMNSYSGTAFVNGDTGRLNIKDVPSTYGIWEDYGDVISQCAYYNSYRYNDTVFYYTDFEYNADEYFTAYHGSTTVRELWEKYMYYFYYVPSNWHDNGGANYYEGNSVLVDWWEEYYPTWSDTEYMSFYDANIETPFSSSRDNMYNYNMPLGVDRDEKKWKFMSACGLEYINECKYSYRYMECIFTEELDGIKHDMAVLEDSIETYRDTCEDYDTAYQDMLNNDIPDKFEDSFIISIASDRNSNSVNPGSIYQRTGDAIEESDDKLWTIKRFCWNGDVFTDAYLTGDYKHISYEDKDCVKVSQGTWYSAPKNLAVNLSKDLQSDMDDIYEHTGSELTLKYRVVVQPNHEKAMTADNIKDLADDSSCAFSLSISQVLDKPYSFGIIINDFTKINESNTIKEWQITKGFSREFDGGIGSSWFDDSTDKIIGYDDGTGTPIKDINDTTHLDGDTNNGLNRVQWYSGKWSGGTASGTQDSISGSGMSHIEPGPSDITKSPSVSAKVLYKITNHYDDEGTDTKSTITALELNLDIDSYEADDKIVTISIEPEASYDAYKDGTVMTLVGNGHDVSDSISSIAFKPYYLQMRSTTTNNTTDTVPVERSGGRYKIIRDGIYASYSDGWLATWMQSNRESKLESPFEIKLDYHSISRVKSTFSTDKEDTNNTMSDSIPVLKAGQAFDVEVVENILIIDAYANIADLNGSGKFNSLSTSNTFDNKDEFESYMNDIVDELRNCPIQVFSTIHGLSVNSKATKDLSDKLGVTYDDTTDTDDTNKTTFDDTFEGNPISNIEASLYYSNQYSGAANDSLEVYNVSSPMKRPFGDSKSDLIKETQNAFNSGDLLTIGKGDSAWYCEYTEAVGIVHYHADIKYGEETPDETYPTYHCSISRYESDFKSNADDRLIDDVTNISENWGSGTTGYNTYLRNAKRGDTSSYANVIATAIDLTELSPDTKELFNVGGNTINYLLGRQTPIHIRGSVYDNT